MDQEFGSGLPQNFFWSCSQDPASTAVAESFVQGVDTLALAHHQMHSFSHVLGFYYGGTLLLHSKIYQLSILH